MANHLETGKKGEMLAACWLIMRGFQILFKNWKNRNGEIDIIARKQHVIHFIEVKTSRSVKFGFPEGRVDRRKLKNMIRSSLSFLEGWPEDVEIQFDILAILLMNKTEQYFFVEDAFIGLQTPWP